MLTQHNQSPPLRGVGSGHETSGRLDARGATPSLPLSYASARLEGGGHDDQPACRGSQNNSDKQGEGGEAETSCAGLHARPKDWTFQNQCAHLDSMLFTARGISAYTSGMNNYSSKSLPKLTQYS